jgi:NAD(P)H-dependent FMN reductase
MYDHHVPMVKLFGLAGSTRERSYNRALLQALADACPPEASLEIESIAGIPMYEADMEAREGIPDRVAQLKDAIAESSGLLLVTPEYNNGIPGPFKNAIDWLSRPPKDAARVFRGKPVALMGATPGAGGTRSAQLAWLPVLRALGTQPWFGQQLYAANAKQLFDGEGKLVDESMRERLEVFMGGFVAFVGKATT